MQEQTSQDLTKEKNTFVNETAEMNDEDRALTDIIDKRSDSKVIFNRYKNKKEIAQQIAKVLFSKKYNSGKGNQAKKFARGFYNTDMDRTQVGLLTQCLGMQAISSLNGFGMDMSSYTDIVDHTLNDIFKQIGFTSEVYEKIVAMGDNLDYGKELLTFNMTPFVKSNDYEDDDDAFAINTCVESACNVLKSLVETRDMIIRQEYDGHCLTLTFESQPVTSAKMTEMIEHLVKYTIGWICSACIPAKKTIHYSIGGKMAKSSLVGYLGWNFFKVSETDEEYEPSMYMTYSVCSAYMSVYQSLQEVFEDADKNRINEAPSYIYTQNKRFYELIVKVFKEFQLQCMSAGRYEEMRANGLIGNEIDLASKFIGQNYVEMDFDDIENSTTNDAVINTVLHVLILIYSGIDLDYDIMGKGDEFFDEMQYALQNILRCYKYLLKEDKTYIVEQYVLSFKEKMPSAVAPLAKVLRRQRIQVASLLPLLIRAYNEVSRYLIKYPQKQNIEYLKLILDNRSDSDKGKEWAWDKEGYNITSENYFIKALFNFYEYYEQYEECYIEPEEVLKNEREKLKTEADKRIEALRKEWSQDKESYKQIIAEKDKTIRELTVNREPLIKEIIAIIDETMTDNFDRYLIEALSKRIATDEDSEFEQVVDKYILHKYFGKILKEGGFQITDKVGKKVKDWLTKIVLTKNGEILSFINGERQ